MAGANATYSYTHIAGAATTNIAPTPANQGFGLVLHAVVVNTPGTLCTIADKAATPSTVAIISTVGVGRLEYDVACPGGITVTTTNAATDITVIWS